MDDTKATRKGAPDGGLPAGMHVQLNFISGPDRGLVKKLWKRATVLGRADADITLSDDAASKQHLEISVGDKGLAVRDLGSTNGTMLNGVPVKRAAVHNLDELTIGETVIKVSILEDAAGAEPSADLIIEADPAGDTTRVRRDRVKSDPLAGPLPAEYRVSLEVMEGPDQGLRFELKNKATIVGRSGADLVLRDPDLSRKHFSIEFMAPNRVMIKDLRSTNGTSLNQKPITVAFLQHGDLIGAGNTVLKFSALRAAGGTQPKKPRESQ